ncbi:Vacuolar protein sorting-associated protein 29 [Pleurostoma richardsiae]|uniref:Vacuolar protein sorting-associated protein 29 n=1 Tax=Pleurostoma richardsiae TaxID=41990 RepID=A0AA38VMP1_9PEZI|nr:Vacuolar protein sorting-associated protein 29 [Pleurostoma richardsiae]
MARLNEPPVSTDTIETLRKKFLRQNRDIARVNSNQSLRIRHLENEYARLLSENLELRARNLELEKELEQEREDSSAQRIVDHALEIRTKMEAQLVQWGELLAGLGLEPPMKRRSPAGRKLAKPRSAMLRSPAQRRLRDVAKDAETQAMQEGRLPPIYENKAYPRQTLSRDEILALCSEADNSNDSPDLGPPPVSRFVDEDPIKVDSPCRTAAQPEDATAKSEDVAAPLPPPDSPPSKLDFNKKPAMEPKKPEDDVSLPPAPPEAVRPPLKAGSKRKFAVKDDDDERKATIVSNTPRIHKEIKPLAVRDVKNRKAIRELAAARRDGRDKATTTPALAAQPRKPLAAKSTNNDISSPKKTAKASALDAVAVAKMDIAKEAVARDGARDKKRIVPIKAPAPEPPHIITIIPETEAHAADTAPACPDTPEPAVSKANARDTPPPADISVHGETSRPNRRARPSISYAEPNLRDKMRRPTKELVDAVSGEGKYIRRASTTHQPLPSSSVKVKSEPEVTDTEAWKDLPAKEAAMARESSRRGSVLSPLAEKDLAPKCLPAPVVMGRPKRVSSVKGSLLENFEAGKETSVYRTTGVDEAEEIVVGPGQEHDPYEFTSMSPASDSKGSQPLDNSKSINSRGSRGSRRSSAALRDNNSLTQAKLDRPSKLVSSRKRVSMAAPKTASLHDLDDAEDSTFESGGEGSSNAGVDGNISARERVSRRRSMML